MSLSAYKPYTARRSAVRLFGPSEYKIFFEETHVRTLTANEEFVDEVLFLMNTAWELGYSSGLACASVAA